MLCENIGTKKPCRTASDNNRPVNKSLFSGFGEHIWLFLRFYDLVTFRLPQYGVLIFYFYIKLINVF